MSETDQESKTEEATEKKTQDALERGEGPVSRELNLVAGLVGLYLAVAAIHGAAPPAFAALRGLIDHSDQIVLYTGADAWRLAGVLFDRAWRWPIAISSIVALVAIAASLTQGVPRIVLHRIAPKWSRISPAGGAKRLIGRRALTEWAKSAAKLTAAGLGAVIVLRAYRSSIEGAWLLDSAMALQLALRICRDMLGVMCIVFGIAAIVDLVMSRVMWRKELRMTRQELKDEVKQSEGDPLVRARLRSLAQYRARRRMMEDVGRATLIVANPVHYAIALRYVREEGGAPLVLAKGRELLALKIRERATSAGIPVVENPPLARAMYDQVEVGRMIPEHFYRAIAEIINFVSSSR